MNREPGWYWVRQVAGMPWEIARTYNGITFHLLNGEVEREGKFEEIGVRIPVPDAGDSCAGRMSLEAAKDYVKLMDRVERLEKAVRWLSKGALYPEHEKGERREDER